MDEFKGSLNPVLISKIIAALVLILVLPVVAGGVGDQSPNCCKDGLDLAYRADAVLFANGTEGLLARAWWACNANMACAGYSWQQLLHLGEFHLTAGTLSNWVDLQMNWTSPLRLDGIT